MQKEIAEAICFELLQLDIRLCHYVKNTKQLFDLWSYNHEMILLSIRECFVNVTHKIINHKSSMYHSLHKYFLTIMSAVIIKKSVTFIFKMGIIRNIFYLSIFCFKWILSFYLPCIHPPNSRIHLEGWDTGQHQQNLNCA